MNGCGHPLFPVGKLQIRPTLGKQLCRLWLPHGCPKFSDSLQNRCCLPLRRYISKKSMPETKDVIKYIILQIFMLSNAQEDSKFIFEKISNPLWVQHRPSNKEFLAWFFKISLERRDFQKPKTEMKHRWTVNKKIYHLSLYPSIINFSRFYIWVVTTFNLFCTKSVKIKHFIFKYLGKDIVIR